MTTTSDLLLTHGEARTSDGEHLELRTVVDRAAVPRGVAVVAPAFGRGMLEGAPIAVYLARNGLAVHRYEWLDAAGRRRPREDHAFTLSAGRERLATALDAARAAHPGLPAAVVGTSLTGRLAYRLAASAAGGDAARGLARPPESVVTLVGVVNVRDTLRRVMDVDYHDAPRAELPDRAIVVGVSVDVPGFWEDGHAQGWFTLESTMADLAAAPGHVANFFSTEDAWVDPDEAAAAFTGPQGGPRRVCEIEAGHHDLGRNPVALQATLARLTEVVLEGLGLAAPAEIVVPGFPEIIGQRIAERRSARDVQEARTG